MENIRAIGYNGHMKNLPDIKLDKFCKGLRERAGYTQEEMAKRLGVSTSTYQRWEYGDRLPNGRYTAKLFALRDELNQKEARTKKS